MNESSLSIVLCTVISPSTCLLDHFIRPRQHVRRNRQADLLGRFQIDDELELLGCSTGKISGLSAF